MLKLNGIEYAPEQYQELANRLAQEYKANPPEDWTRGPKWIEDLQASFEERGEFTPLFLKAMGWWKERCHCEPCELWRKRRSEELTEWLKRLSKRDGQKEPYEPADSEEFARIRERREDEQCLG